MSDVTRIDIPRSRAPQSFCVRLLRQEEDRLRNEARIAFCRANYTRADALKNKADRIANQIAEASGHA